MNFRQYALIVNKLNEMLADYELLAEHLKPLAADGDADAEETLKRIFHQIVRVTLALDNLTQGE